MTSFFVCVPVVALTLAALILSCLSSMSLPRMDGLAITQTIFSNGTTIQTNGTNFEIIDEIKFGIWTACIYNQDEKTRLCDINVSNFINSQISHALVFEPVCTGFIFAAFLSSFSIREKYVAITFWSSALATVLSLISLGLNITVLMLVHEGMNEISSHSQTFLGNGFYLSIGVVVLIGLAATVAFLGRNSGYKRPLPARVPFDNVS